MNEGFDTSYEELLKRVESMLGSRQSAERWIHKPALGLDGARPVDMLASAEGVRLLDEFLGRLEYGVYTLQPFGPLNVPDSCLTLARLP